jgi:hypothetical protein
VQSIRDFQGELDLLAGVIESGDGIIVGLVISELNRCHCIEGFAVAVGNLIENQAPQVQERNEDGQGQHD